MKTILNILTTFALFIGAFHLNSCTALTKGDAVNLGGKLALSSLNLAARILEGEELNVKAEVGKIGLALASDATTKAIGNLSAASVVTASENAAKEAIQDATVESPEVSVLAHSIASQATDAALTNIQSPAR